MTGPGPLPGKDQGPAFTSETPRWIGSGGNSTAAIIQRQGEPATTFAVFQHGKPAPDHLVDRLVYLLNQGEGEPTSDDDVMWFADAAQDVLCTRCLTPGRGWTWNGATRCEPCHRFVYGDHATDDLILSDHDSYSEWWTDDFLDRTAGRDET